MTPDGWEADYSAPGFVAETPLASPFFPSRDIAHRLGAAGSKPLGTIGTRLLFCPTLLF